VGAQAVQAWIAFAGELLTKKGEWRKGQALARELAGNEEILEALRALLSLPPATYEDGQWKALGALARVARAAVANLKVAFAARGQADFIEIAQGALRALGTDEEPTDLLLALDYRIRHILVDEFQDTSVSQYELLARLTSGWEPGDGRTLFAVGDPMQSIYRFREAEVGLFLRARREGIGSVAPERITLSANFRSRRGIVEWVNRAFTRVMPAREDVGSGAVTYSPSRAIHEDGEGGEGVTVHAFFDGDRLGEARRVASLAKAALSESAATDGKPRTVAILVRARSALAQIVPALKAEGLRLCAVEIDPLAERPVVRDLLALTRALLHPADRAAWLGVLRAPWCGLTLADLLALAGREETAAGDSPQDCGDTILEAILDERRLARLSADGAARLARTRAVLCAALANRCRGTLRRAVEGAWLALGGPACVEDGPALEEADAYLDHLEQAEDAGGLADLAAFEEGLEKLFAPPDESADRRLQVMTIHKAKGLEFDTVIVPGLGAGVPPDERRLFLWMERPRTGRDGAQTDLLLAPMHPAGAQKDPIHEYIRGLDRMKGDLENGRLLYVAATRAKRRLHLLGDAKRGDGEDRAALKGPRKGSLLAKLWPAVEEDFARAAREAPGEPGLVPHLPPRGPKGLARLAPSFVLPAAPAPVAWHPPAEEGREEEPVEFSWAGETARLSGIVVHRWLQCIAEEGLKGWDAGRVRSLGPRIRSELLLRGQLASDLEEAAVRVERALVRALDDAKGRWILGPHAWAACEYRVTAVAGGARRRLVMDRVFTDEHGARWIVDYKSGAHEGAGVEAFLDREKERYAPKMRSYEAALGPGARAALYFPLIPGWREIG
jgi:ATP-dependent exoDNAse (exonuclease V) beta subunit